MRMASSVIPDKAMLFWKLELNLVREEEYIICPFFFLVVIHLVDNQTMALFLELWCSKEVLKAVMNWAQILRVMVAPTMACCLKADA